MAPDTKVSTDFRTPTASKWRAPRAIVDEASGTLIATAEVAAHPERVFRALTTNEVERWWGHHDSYRQTEWAADLRVCGQWSVTVVFVDGSVNHASREFAEIDAPRKLVMTRRFEKHPLQGTRQTTIRDVPAGVEPRSRLFCPGRMDRRANLAHPGFPLRPVDREGCSLFTSGVNQSGSNLLPNRIFWARPIVFITA